MLEENRETLFEATKTMRKLPIVEHYLLSMCHEDDGVAPAKLQPMLGKASCRMVKVQHFFVLFLGFSAFNYLL